MTNYHNNSIKPIKGRSVMCPKHLIPCTKPGACAVMRSSSKSNPAAGLLIYCDCRVIENILKHVSAHFSNS